jgi:NCS1 family nucleobase:cation symporter-1
MAKTVEGAGAPPPPTRVETRSIDYVPVRERHGRVWHLGPLWFAGNAQLASLAIGAAGVASGLSFSWSLVAIMIGLLIGTLFMAFHSAQGPKLGLPQMIQSRPQFGYYGSLLPVIVAVLLFIGFNVFNTQIAAVAVEQTANVNVTLATIIICGIAYIWAIFGYRLIHVYSQWASLLFIVAYVIFTIGLAFGTRLPAGFFSFGAFKADPFLLQLGIILSYQLTWAPYVSEYSRYLPRTSTTAATFWWTYLGSGLGILWLAGLGDFLAAAFPKITSSVTQIHVAGNAFFHGWGFIVLLCSWPGLVAVIGLNMYSGGLSTLTTIDAVKPIKPTLTLRVAAVSFIAVAGTALSLTIPGTFLTDFSAFLTIILYFMIPWTAVNLVDFFFIRKGNYAIKEIFRPNGMYHRWGWRGLVAYWVGFFAMAPFMSTTLYTGFVAKSLGGSDISPFVGFPVAAVLYAILCRGLDLPAERRVAAQQMAEIDPQGAVGLAEASGGG